MKTREAKVGDIVWQELTVANADKLRDFYREVVGWEIVSRDADGYQDYEVTAPGSGEHVASIAHARGEKTNIPPQWLLYVKVADVDASAEQCAAQGGEVIDGPRTMADGRICVIMDPAGAVMALISTD